MLKDKDLKEIQGLISVGKERGYVTYEEMNNVLPTHLVSDDQLDDVMILFNKMDIEVVNQVKAARKKGNMPEDAAADKKASAKTAKADSAAAKRSAEAPRAACPLSCS